MTKKPNIKAMQEGLNRTRLRLPMRSRQSLVSITIDCFVGVLGFLGSLLLHLVGDFYASEIILIVIAPILLMFRGRGLLRPQYIRIFALLGLWLVGVIVTDAYRLINLQDRLRGMATILFFGIEIAAFALLLGRSERRKAIFLMTYAIGSIVMARVNPPLLFEDDPWKFGYSYGTMLLVILISCYFFRRRIYPVAGLLYFGLIIANLLFNYRSPVLFLLLLMVLVLPIIPERIGRLQLLPNRRSFARVAVLAGFALGSAAISDGLIHWATAAGLVGEEAQAKNLEQEQSTAGILFGGRPEMVASSRAVMDSPILGHGSWAKDFKYVEILNDFLAENGFRTDIRYVEAEENAAGLIPSHSHLMGAWVQAGILGAVFWGYILWLTIRGIVRVSLVQSALTPVMCWLMVELFWDNLFSPFGSFERIYAAFTIVVIVDLLDVCSRPQRRASLIPDSRWQREGWRRNRRLQVAG